MRIGVGILHQTIQQCRDRIEEAIQKFSETYLCEDIIEEQRTAKQECKLKSLGRVTKHMQERK